MRFIAWMPWFLIVALHSPLNAKARPAAFHTQPQAGPDAYQQRESDSEPDPVAVVRSMAAAFNEGDLEEIVAYFGESFELTMRPAFPSTSDRTWEVSTREWAQDLIDNDFRIELEVEEAEGNRVRTLTTTWQNITRFAGMAPLVAVENYVVEDGQITSLTWTASDEAWDRYYAFRRKVFTGLGTVVVLALGLTWWLLRRRKRRSLAT